MPTTNNSGGAGRFPKTEARRRAFRNALRAWFARERREMPWRRERSLYRTVVSEFMLQQTQVETVRPYFEKWVARWRSFAELAEANADDVLRAWEGLGYYSRARNLHALAQKIAAHGVPETLDGWRAFRGVGDYTAAAIASISQGVPAAVTDGNVVRILARLSADETPFKDNSAAVKHFAPLAGTLLDAENPGEHNEAMMELGALVCTKPNPRCAECPVAAFCDGRNRLAENVASLPRFAPRAAKKIRIDRAFVRFADGSVLLAKTHASARRLREIFEFPRWEDFSPNAAPNAGTLLLEGTRGIAQESIRERIFAGTPPKNFHAGKTPSGAEWMRVPADELEKITLSGPHRKWLRKILSRQ